MRLVSSNHPGYMVDKDTGVVINTNDRELSTYRLQVEKHYELKTMKEDFDDVKRELQELRSLLKAR